jgi:hypothetical protein
MNPPLIPVLGHINPTDPLIAYFFKRYYNILDFGRYIDYLDKGFSWFTSVPPGKIPG